MSYFELFLLLSVIPSAAIACGCLVALFFPICCVTFWLSTGLSFDVDDGFEWDNNFALDHRRAVCEHGHRVSHDSFRKINYEIAEKLNKKRISLRRWSIFTGVIFVISMMGAIFIPSRDEMIKVLGIHYVSNVKGAGDIANNSANYLNKLLVSEVKKYTEEKMNER